VLEEVSFEEAHQVGIELCEKILGVKYEYVLATHIDKGNIHNHIIFNSIDVDEGKVYHSYYGSYMDIRNQSIDFVRNIFICYRPRNTKKNQRD